MRNEFDKIKSPASLAGKLQQKGAPFYCGDGSNRNKSDENCSYA